ncbi:MAG: hypothetical protein K2L07_11350 [Lachnospiraceae bacterium]|nr:hypothetical protein [Lachnospiraceae bacterium]
MKRIWNALRYGDSETRKCIGSVIFFSILGIVLILVSGILGQFYLFIVGMIVGVVAIVVSQSFTLVDDDFVAETGKHGEKNSVVTVSVIRNGVSSSNAQPNKKTNNSDSVEKGISKQKENESIETEKQLDEEKEKQREEVVKKDNKKKTKEKDFYDEEQSAKNVDLSHYNARVLKKIKRKYRVRRDHRPVLIDNSKSYQIKECPAFIWRIHNKVYLLLLEKEPRRISISRDLIRHVDYVPKVRANRKMEYQVFRKENMVTSVFKEYLPDYFESKVKNEKLKYKNLYQIYPDIQFSNRSILDVMDLLCLNFMPEDKLTRSDKVNGFFKRVYAANILFKDRVYSIREYKEVVEQALEEMCYAEIPAREFEITLENLVKARLISQEYAQYYTEVRKRLGKKTVPVTYTR